MDPPRDPWLQEQLDQFKREIAEQTAFYQRAARLLSARPLLASRPVGWRRCLVSSGWLLYWLLGRFVRRGYPLARNAPQSNAAVTFDVTPAIIEGIVTSATTENDESAATVIVIGLPEHLAGRREPYG